MATHLDLQEQEQLDNLKAFWKQYGNLILWLLIIVMGAFGGLNAWNWYQRSQSGKATALFDELERQVRAGDAERSTRAFNDLKERYPRTVQAEHGGLLASKLQHDKGQADAALATLQWLGDNATEDEYRAVARLRAAALLMDKQQYDEALKQLDGIKKLPSFEPLVADRRGDVLMAQGKKDDAKAAYLVAWKGLEAKLEYRRWVEAKLSALGASPEPLVGGELQ